MNVKAPVLNDQAKAALGQLSPAAKRSIIDNFAVMATIEPRLRRWDWIVGATGVVNVVVQIGLGAWAGYVGFGALNLAAALIGAVGLQRSLRRARKRRRALGEVAALAHYLASVYPPR